MEGFNESSEFLEHVCKVIRENANYPEFADCGVPIKVAARVLGLSEDTIRNLMEQGNLRIGTFWYTQGKRAKKPRRNVYISPKLFWELTGYIWNGNDNVDGNNT